MPVGNVDNSLVFKLSIDASRVIDTFEDLVKITDSYIADLKRGVITDAAFVAGIQKNLRYIKAFKQEILAPTGSGSNTVIKNLVEQGRLADHSVANLQIRLSKLNQEWANAGEGTAAQKTLGNQIAQTNALIVKQQQELKKLKLQELEKQGLLPAKKGGHTPPPPTPDSLAQIRNEIKARQTILEQIPVTDTTRIIAEQQRLAELLSYEALQRQRLHILSKLRQKDLTQEQRDMEKLRLQFNEQKIIMAGLERQGLKGSTAYANAAKRADEINKQMHANAQKSKNSIGGLTGAWNKFTNIFKGTVLATISYKIFTAITNAIATTITSFVDFEKEMKQLQAVSGASAAELNKLERVALRTAATTRFFASEIGNLQVELAKLGFQPIEIENSTKAITNLAIASGEDLVEAGTVAATVLRGFGLNAVQTTKVTDVMTASFNQSALDLTKFRNSIKYIAPIARSVGVDLEGVSAALSVLADRGISGSQAGTSMRRILTELGTSGTKAAKFLGFTVRSTDDFIKAIQKLNDANMGTGLSFKLFGRYAQSAVLALSQSANTLRLYESLMRDVAGTAEATANIQRESLSNIWLELKSAAEALAISIGDRLSPAMKGIVGWTRDLLQSWAQFFAIPIADKIEAQRREMNALVLQAISYNKETKERNAILSELIAKYPEYLGGLKKEEISNQVLVSILKEANKELLIKAGLMQVDENVEKSMQRQVKLLEQEGEAVKRISDLFGKQEKIFGVRTLEQINNAEETKGALDNLLKKYGDRDKTPFQFFLRVVKDYEGDYKAAAERFTELIVDEASDSSTYAKQLKAFNQMVGRLDIFTQKAYAASKAKQEIIKEEFESLNLLETRRLQLQADAAVEYEDEFKKKKAQQALLEADLDIAERYYELSKNLSTDDPNRDAKISEAKQRADAARQMFDEGSQQYIDYLVKEIKRVETLQKGKFNSFENQRLAKLRAELAKLQEQGLATTEEAFEPENLPTETTESKINKEISRINEKIRDAIKEENLELARQLAESLKQYGEKGMLAYKEAQRDIFDAQMKMLEEAERLALAEAERRFLDSKKTLDDQIIYENEKAKITETYNNKKIELYKQSYKDEKQIILSLENEILKAKQEAADKQLKLETDKRQATIDILRKTAENVNTLIESDAKRKASADRIQFYFDLQEFIAGWEEAKKQFIENGMTDEQIANYYQSVIRKMLQSYKNAFTQSAQEMLLEPLKKDFELLEYELNLLEAEKALKLAARKRVLIQNLNSGKITEQEYERGLNAIEYELFNAYQLKIAEKLKREQKNIEQQLNNLTDPFLATDEGAKKKQELTLLYYEIEKKLQELGLAGQEELKKFKEAMKKTDLVDKDKIEGLQNYFTYLQDFVQQLSALAELYIRQQITILEVELNAINARIKKQEEDLDRYWERMQRQIDMAAIEDRQALKEEAIAHANSVNAQIDYELARREELEDRKKELEKEAFERNKRFSIADATIKGALAVLNAFATAKDPVSLGIMAALAALTTAVQIATIAATQFSGAFGGFMGQMFAGQSMITSLTPSFTNAKTLSNAASTMYGMGGRLSDGLRVISGGNIPDNGMITGRSHNPSNPQQSGVKAITPSGNIVEFEGGEITTMNGKIRQIFTRGVTRNPGLRMAALNTSSKTFNAKKFIAASTINHLGGGMDYAGALKHYGLFKYGGGLSAYTTPKYYQTGGAINSVTGLSLYSGKAVELLQEINTNMQKSSAAISTMTDKISELSKTVQQQEITVNASEVDAKIKQMNDIRNRANNIRR